MDNAKIKTFGDGQGPTSTKKFRGGNPDIVNRTEIWLSQQQRVFSSLYSKPQTRLQVAHSSNVPIQNVCRYIKTFKESQTICVLKVDRCPISGMKAEILSCNPAHFPKGQLKMFEA